MRCISIQSESNYDGRANGANDTSLIFTLFNVRAQVSAVQLTIPARDPENFCEGCLMGDVVKEESRARADTGEQETNGGGKGDKSSKSKRIDLVPEDSSRYRVTAVYHDAALEPPEYRQNPLILALPPYHKRLDVATAITSLYSVPHDDAFRSWPTEIRLMALARIFRHVVGQPIHLKLLDWIHQNMRAHYQPLFDSAVRTDRQSKYVCQQAGGIETIELSERSHSPAVMVTGLSGVGKSTAVKLALNQFPRVIDHEEFNGRTYRVTQIVWLYSDCAHNASVGALCRSILADVDLLLGTYYEKEMGSRRVNAADYVRKVATVLRYHRVGLLVLDEIQNLLGKGPDGRLLDELVNMLNGRPCPVLCIGTPETALLGPKKMRVARRIGAHEIALHPFPKGAKAQGYRDRDWFLHSITRLDFLAQPFTDISGVYGALMTASAGVPAFITLAWWSVQYLGITKGKAMVTPDLVRAATREIFGMVRGLISALERRDYRALAMIGDAAVDTLRTEIDRWVTDEDSVAFHDARAKQQDINQFYSALAVLMSLGIGQGDAERNISTVQRETPEADVKEIVRRVLEIRRKPFTSMGEATVDDSLASQKAETAHVADIAAKEARQPTRTPQSLEGSCIGKTSIKRGDAVGNFRIRKKKGGDDSRNAHIDEEQAVEGGKRDLQSHPASEMEI